MIVDPKQTRITRREILRGGIILAGGVCLEPSWLLGRSVAAQQAPLQDANATMRAQMGAAPIEQLKLTDTLTMLSGPGGNVLVSHGSDGKVVVDSFVRPAWDRLKQTLDAMGGAPVKVLIDTHWHFDHADNNGISGRSARRSWRTRTPPSECRNVMILRDGRFPPRPPTHSRRRHSRSTHTLEVNADRIRLGHIPPAHTDTDIYIQYEKPTCCTWVISISLGRIPSSTAATPSSTLAGRR